VLIINAAGIALIADLNNVAIALHPSNPVQVIHNYFKTFKVQEKTIST
jgi:hypothetical protein